MLKIFRKLRWHLTFWFIVLTMSVFLISALFGGFIFKTAMTRFVDYELTALTTELEPAIEIVNGRPSLQTWKKNVFRGPFRYLPMIQLYDKEGNLIESYGPPGIPVLISRSQHARRDIKEETYHIRVHSTPLNYNDELVGYLQLELSLKNVDGALSNFGITLALIAPFVLLAFGLAGYFFSSIAARPVEKSFGVLQRFMADASHELNTPISIVMANAESLEADVPDNESIKGRLATITRSATRMNNLVGDLMLLAKMESPNILKDKNLVDLDKILLAVIEDFDELFKAKSVDLKEDLIQPVQLHGDSESLKRLITNLLQNALKYTNEGGTIKTSLEIIGNHCRLTISDTGIGIAPENLPLIFDRFYRAEPSRARNAGGSGLGLSIVKAIVDAHKGRIEINSTLGQGTNFAIYFPLKV